jgi:murein DD-endopeptidase MepM/ murein hydrolase activator NlpD
LPATGSQRSPQRAPASVRRPRKRTEKELIELPSNGQNRLYERLTLAVALLAILIVGTAALADDAEAQAIADPVATSAEPATTTTTTSTTPTTTTTPEATTTTPEAAPAPTAATPASSAGKGGTGAGGSKGRLRLKVSKATPGNVILDSRNPAHYKFALAGTGSRDIVVRAIDTSSDKTVMHWKFKHLAAKKTEGLSWNGKLGARSNSRGSGGFAKDGKYTFKVYEAGDRGGEPADASKADGKSRISVHTHEFPVAAHHTYGDGFGAGRHHQGQDILAPCGKKIRAARGGRVQTSSYQSAAGNYVVIDGKGTKWDYVYMHMPKRDLPRKGERLHTGDLIGYIGQTGDATGCHLHFEMWSPPGWYEGGSAKAPTKALKKWDRYS